MSASPASSDAAGLFERHRASVFAYCLSRLGRRDEAEDAVQTTFVRALQSLDAGIVPASEPAWLLGIARNVCLARRESAARRGRLEEVRDPADLESAAGHDTHRHDELIGLADALRRLPEPQRRAVLLRDWRGLAYDEIATELGVSHAAVETLIFRGRNALAALLEETPSATRRRLASLGDVGALFASVKHAFLGAAAGTKVAAALVAVAAVSGAGLAVGRTASAPEPRPSPPASLPSPAPAAAKPTAAATPSRPPAASGRERAAPGAAPVTRRPAPRETTPAAPAPAAAPAPVAPVAPAAPPAPTTNRVDEVLEPLAVDVPAAAGELEQTVATAAGTVEQAVGTVEETVARVETVVEDTAAALPPAPAPPAAPALPPLP